MSRPVHYHAHGNGLRFDCFNIEARAWSDDYRRAQAEAQAAGAPSFHVKVATLYPRRSTNLAKVSCEDCWKEIATMVVREHEVVRPLDPRAKRK
jgi:hypothetical protein